MNTDLSKSDPYNIDKTIYNNIIHENNKQLKGTKGYFTSIIHKRNIKTVCLDNFNLSVPLDICHTYIIHQHCLDVAEQFSDHGITNFNITDPVVINPIGKEFIGANLGICDEIKEPLIHLRSSLYISCFDSNINFKDDNCFYSNLVAIIRPPNPLLGFYVPEKVFKLSIITAPVQPKSQLINDKLSISEFAKLCSTIECCFQTAISFKHKILILPPFGIYGEDIPINDVILVFNYCIYKYGHLLKNVIIAIPPYFPDEYFDFFKKNIVDTVALCQQVEDEHYKKEYIKRATEKKPAEDLQELEKIFVPE